MPNKAKKIEMPPYANQIGYTDVNPWEVIKVVSKKTLEIRKMDCEHINKADLTFHVGGFSAHCSNQHEQVWAMKSNPDALVWRIRLHKDGKWYHHNIKFELAEKPRKFYDFNF